MNYDLLFVKLKIRFHLRQSSNVGTLAWLYDDCFRGLPLSKEDFDRAIRECQLEGTITLHGNKAHWHEECLGLVEVLRG
jgi:hypothetical protein